MTKKAKENAYKHFGLEVGNSKGLVLHHIDETLKEMDNERYNEWRIEDLTVLTREEHARIHHTGKKRSIETCENISKANTGIKNNFTFYKNIETGETISIKDGESIPEGFIKGRIISSNTIKKISSTKKGSIPWNKGTKLTEEQKKKQKGKNKGNFIGGKSKCAKKVNQYSLDGSFIKTWDSMSTAERELKGINRKHIGACCNGKRKSHGGFLWRFA